MGAISRHSKAWTEFWQSQGNIVGCCSKAPEILRPIDAHWSKFAQSLAANSVVVDIGCGSGAAGRSLIRANPSLRVKGIDFAQVSAPDGPRLEILSGTSMECLPFADGSIDASVSQFGFEYGCVGEASRELARVLRPGAPFSFLVHHSGSRIATDSAIYRNALLAITGAEVEAAFLSGAAGSLDQQIARIHGQFPNERIVKEAAAGLYQLIGQAPVHRLEIWRAVQAALEPEMLMLAELQRSAVSPAGLQAWLSPLSAWFALYPPAVMQMTGSQPLCWMIEAVRSKKLH